MHKSILLLTGEDHLQFSLKHQSINALSLSGSVDHEMLVPMHLKKKTILLITDYVA